MKTFVFTILCLLIIAIAYRQPQNRWPSQTGMTLNRAVESGNLEEVSRMVESGASVEGNPSPGYSDRTPLESAFNQKDPDIALYLIDHGASLKPKIHSPYGPLLYQAARSDISIVKRLLDSGLDPNSGVNEFTPLHLLGGGNQGDRSYDTDQTIQAKIHLLIRYGANPNLQDQHGQTPLHIAAKHNTPAAVKALLEEKANPNLQDRDGNTPLHLAADMHSYEIIRMLLRANVNKHAKNKAGATPLDLVGDIESLLAKSTGGKK
jgi:cytohesin